MRPELRTISNRTDNESAMANVAKTSPIINDIRAQRNAESPLLRLPSEIKIQIYEHVCGGRSIHIDKTKGRLSHQLCAAWTSEVRAQTIFDASQEKWFAFETADRHMGCRSHTKWLQDCALCRPYCKYLGSQSGTLETNMLRCCRQMYQEAKFVPYYANIFSFASAMSLYRFCQQTPEPYKTTIRSLHVNLIVFVGGPRTRSDWELAFKTVATTLTGLKRLHISMELCPGKENLPYEEPMPVEESYILNHVLLLGKLDLNLVTIVLSDSHFTHEWYETQIKEREARERWTLAQKQEWSRYLRKALLHDEDRDSDLASLKQEAAEQGRICRL